MRLYLLFLGLMLVSALAAQKNPEQVGKCGYYSDALHGRKTSSGEPYDKNLLTCAHKSLPFGTILKVTRLDNQKSVEVRVNDRGPYVDGYVVDISRKAAEQIDLIKAGVTKVKIEVVEPLKAPEFVPAEPGPAKEKSGEFDQSPDGSTADADATGKAMLLSKTQKQATVKKVSSPVAAAPAISKAVYRVNVSQPAVAGFGIQTANLNNAKNALEEMQKLQGVLPDQVLLLVETDSSSGEKVAYKVVGGPFVDRAAAEKKQKELAQKGFPKAFLIDLNNL